MSEEKSVSAANLFHTLMTRSQKKLVRILRLFDFLNNLYMWPRVCVTVEYSNKSFAFTITRPKQVYSTIQDVLGFVNLNAVNVTFRKNCEVRVLSGMSG